MRFATPRALFTFVAVLIIGAAIALGTTSCEDAVKKKVEKAEETKEKASTMEANDKLNDIADAARIYFNSEHAAPDGMTVTSNSFPKVRSSVCSAGGVEGEKVGPSDTSWDQSPWKELRFSIGGEHAYMYCYDAAEDGKSFAAWAELGETAVCVTGTARGGQIVINGPRTLGPEDGCMW